MENSLEINLSTTNKKFFLQKSKAFKLEHKRMCSSNQQECLVEAVRTKCTIPSLVLDP